jgi:opacity protein-like surface antigen
VDRATAERLVAKAHNEICTYSKAIVIEVAAPWRIGTNTYTGWFIGSGFEYSFDFLPGLFFKTEYQYSTFNSANFPVLTAAGGPSPFAINSTTSKCLA